jgi:DNA-binding transcriptional LysR family regulator
MTRGSDYASFVTFMAVSRERSFRRAAETLGLSPSALSHTIRLLEARLGTRLLNRTTRSVALTQAGQLLLDRLLPAFSSIDDAVAAIEAYRTKPAGTVRINAPRMAALMVLAPILGRFARTFPDIHLEIIVDDGLVDIVSKGFSAGIRLGEHLHQDMVAVAVTPELRAVVAGSPAYFASRLPPMTPTDLMHHECINYRLVTSGTIYRWEFERAGESMEIAVNGPLTVDDADIMLAAALDGVGLAVLIQDQIMHHVAEGRLICVLEDWSPAFPGFYLYYPAGRQMPAALRAFIDFLVAK